jgi:hypothetical protein
MRVNLTAKRAALRIIESMPAGASLEGIVYELYFRRRVDRGLRDLRRGRTVSHAHIRRSVPKWLESAGR